MTDNTRNPGAGAPAQCAAGCGFYAASAFNGYCSKCYKTIFGAATPSLTAAATPLGAIPPSPLGEAALSSPASSGSASRTASLAVAAASSAASTRSAAGSDADVEMRDEPGATTAPAVHGVGSPLVTSSPALSAVTAAGDGTPGVQANKGRCWGCKKKVGLTGFECRCGYIFCGLHRYADQHACSFDYKTHDRDLLTKLNPQVKADKLEKV